MHAEILNLGEYVVDNLLQELDKLWKLKVPSKILIFGKRLLLDRLLTIVELAKMSVLGDNHNCFVPSVSNKRNQLNTFFFVNCSTKNQLR